MVRTEILSIIVDGYNLLKTTGMLQQKARDKDLEIARTRLLRYLATLYGSNSKLRKRSGSRQESNLPQVTVVFDSQTNLDLPTRFNSNGIEVLFSKGYENADELIIELIQKHSVPKRLLVVTSDHEIQTAAERRRAQFVDSDVWLDQLEAVEKGRVNSKPPQKNADKVSPPEVDSAKWLEIFGDVDVEEISQSIVEPDLKSDRLLNGDADIQSQHLDQPIEQNKSGADPSVRSSDPALDAEEIVQHYSDEELEAFLKQGDDKRPRRKPKSIELDHENEEESFFPPGYGEDLLDES